MLVMGPGRYRFKHYLSIGSGMAVIAWLGQRSCGQGSSLPENKSPHNRETLTPTKMSPLNSPRIA
jgi:hypothetical protein